MKSHGNTVGTVIIYTVLPALRFVLMMPALITGANSGMYVIVSGRFYSPCI